MSSVIEAPARRPAPARPAHPPRHRTDTGRMASLLLALPAALVSLAWSLPELGNRSLWNDEYATWYAATLAWPDLGKLLDYVDAVVAPPPKIGSIEKPNGSTGKSVRDFTRWHGENLDASW